MADQLPNPLVPAEVDLRGMEFMPLKGDILFKSTTWLKGSHEARCAALRLWWHAFAHEVPAASLPDDDQLLAEHAGYGEVVKAWLKIKPQAMRGWVKCSDGRWYHKVVGDLALEAWGGRVRNREKARKWRERKAAGTPSGDGNEGGSVPVTRPSRDRLQSEGQSQSQLQGQSEEAAASSAAAREPASPPETDQLRPPPAFDRSVDQAFALWQQTAAKEGWPEAMFLNGERRVRLQAILAICGGVDGFAAALETAKSAKFLHGTDGRMHRWFHLDWILDQSKFTRLMEGRYAERHDSSSEQRSSVAALADWGREGDS